MIFSKPTKHQDTRIGQADSYDLESDDLTFVIESVAGGWRAFNPTEENSLVYVMQGIGSAKLKDTKDFAINGEVAIPVPSHSFFKLEEGQYRYIYARGVANHSLEVNKGVTSFNPSTNSRLAFVLDGIGNVKVDGINCILKEGYLFEFPKDAEVELNGNFKYLFING